MKVRYLLGTVAALVALLAIGATACGGGDDGDDALSANDIQTQKGIVSAAGAGFGGQNLEGGDDLALAGAPASQIATDGGGIGGDRASLDIEAGFGVAPYPYLQTGGTGSGITVQGNGTATASADSARIELYFGRFQDKVFPFPEPFFDGDVDFGDADGATSSGSTGVNEVESAPPPPDEFFDEGFLQEEVLPITEADLQPVIDAIKAAGVAASDIEFVDQGYYDPYYASASLRVTVSAIDSIGAIIDAATDAAALLETIELQNSNVSYSLADCATLQTAALETAIADAGDNGALFAEALGVGLGEIIGAANFSYFPSDGSACDSYYGYYGVYDEIGFRGIEEAEVQVYANVSVTYAIATP